MRHTANFTLVMLIGIAIWQISATFPKSSGKFRDTDAIVVSGDSRYPDFFSDAKRGAEVALGRIKESGELPKEGGISIITLDSQKLNADDRWQLRMNFCRMLVKTRPIIIVSADFSTTAVELAQIATVFRVPVAFVVATNDDVIGDDIRPYCLRLIPKDSLQAKVISDWCGAFKKPALFYSSDTVYGRDLAQKTIEEYHKRYAIRDSSGEPAEAPVKGRLAPQKSKIPPVRMPASVPNLLISSYNDAAEIYSTLKIAKENGCDALAFIGYSRRFHEINSKLRSLEWKSATLLSDGFYSKFLVDSKWEMDYYLSSPFKPKYLARRTLPNSDGEFTDDSSRVQPKLQEIRGCGVLTHDLCLVAVAASINQRPPYSSPEAVMLEIRRGLEHPSEKFELLSHYKFDGANGGQENIAGNFTAFRLSDLKQEL